MDKDRIFYVDYPNETSRTGISREWCISWRAADSFRHHCRRVAYRQQGNPELIKLNSIKTDDTLIESLNKICGVA